MSFVVGSGYSTGAEQVIISLVIYDEGPRAISNNKMDCLPVFLLRAGITSALPGDINRDGTVDFDDFFLLADDFGRSGPPVGVADTVFIVRRDTLDRIVEVPVLLRDTVYVNLDSLGALGQVLNFSDPNLEASVRSAVGRETGPLFEQHVQSLNFLDASGRSIALLGGIEKLSALTSLSLSDNQIVSLSPLLNLTSIASLNLSNNKIRSLVALVSNSGLGPGASVVLLDNPLGVAARSVEIPALEVAVRSALALPLGDLLTLDLELLTQLHVSNRGIADLAGIEYLIELRELFIDGNQVVDIGPLASLVHLTSLRVENNQIVDLSPLQTLTGLREFNAEGNQIERVEGLRGLSGLRTLDLGGNQIADLSPLAALVALSDVRLESNLIEDLVPLSGLSLLEQLDLSSNRIVDISPLLVLTGLDDLWLVGNSLDSPSVLNHIPVLESAGTFVRF
jgi:Leucine-rich repeat (LRR) protein